MTRELKPLKAPFPYPGGKARIADLVWRRLGDCANYIEPFAGSLAVLLRRPNEHFIDGYRVETINDASHFIVNFWRAVTAEPERVAEFADRPVTEADLHASHKWLMRSAAAAAFRKGMVEDPFYFDAKIAGYWVHGQCCWIGGAWCNDVRTDYQQIPGVNADGKGYGVNRGENPTLSEQIPELGHGAGRGVTASGGRPQLTDAFDIGRGGE